MTGRPARPQNKDRIAPPQPKLAAAHIGRNSPASCPANPVHPHLQVFQTSCTGQDSPVRGCCRYSSPAFSHLRFGDFSKQKSRSRIVLPGLEMKSSAIPTLADCGFSALLQTSPLTSIFDFLHIRKGTLAIAAPADQRQPQIRTLTFIWIPTALNGWRRVRV